METKETESTDQEAAEEEEIDLGEFMQAATDLKVDTPIDLEINRPS